MCLERNLFLFHFIHHKSHIDLLGSNPDLCDEKLLTKLLSNGIAQVVCLA
jgi:hypothetical protein